MKKLKKAYLEITNLCNLRCSFCPGTGRKTGFIAPEDFRLLAGRLRPHTDYLYLHLMGEPLMHPKLDELLGIAEGLDFRVMVTTNGTMLPERGGLLIDSPAVEKVSISLHSFEGNEGDEAALAAYLERCLTFAAAAGAAGKKCGLRLWNLDGEETQGANDRNEEILARMEAEFPKPWKEGRRGTGLAPNIYLEWGERFEWPDLDAREGETRFCMGLRDQVGVLWDGTVVPCCLVHEGDIPLGNLYEQSLEDILNTPRARAIYDGFSQGRAAEELCRRCGYARRF